MTSPQDTISTPACAAESPQAPVAADAAPCSAEPCTTDECKPEEPEAAELPTATDSTDAPCTTATDSTDTPCTTDETEAPEAPRYATTAEVLAAAQALAESDSDVTKQDLDRLKIAFYHLLAEERRAAAPQEPAEGEEAPATEPVADDTLPRTEEDFKAAMAVIRDKRHIAFEQQEAERKAAGERKQAIIDRIKELATSPEQAGSTYQEVKALQQEWRDIKAVPQEIASELWRNYQLATEQFYDMLKLNIEAREYDFAKNLEAKTALCEQAEKLGEMDDVVSAFHQLQTLHDQYREIGPVAKDLREALWTRFKKASTVVNKRHADHFEAIRKTEQENLAKKTELCDQVEMISTEGLKTNAQWDAVSKQVIDLQAQWKTIGYASRALNTKIYERFRTACDQFFAAKKEYYNSLRALYADNIAKKEALIEQAKQLADSTEWRETADKLIALQKEWKTVGTTPRKVGDKLWETFRGACDQFFNARAEATGAKRNARSEEQAANLQQKLDITARLHEMLDTAEAVTQDAVQALVDKWNTIGHVPFKDKDTLLDDYHQTLDALFKKLNIARDSRRLNAFRERVKDSAAKGDNAIDSERTRLMRRAADMQAELDNYEANLQRLTAFSKKGSTLIDEMNRKADRLRDELKLIKEKINVVG